MKKQLSTLFALIVLLLGQTSLMADAPYYPLIVNGSPNLDARYDNGVLTVRFRRTLKPAGSPTSYKQIPPGSGAWVDRPVNAQEPVVLKQKMTPARANEVFARIKQNGGYWKFYCRNTGAGYFEASRSEADYAATRID